MTAPVHLPAPSTRHLTPGQRQQLADNLESFAWHILSIKPDPANPTDISKTIFTFVHGWRGNEELFDIFDRIVSTGISKKEFARRAIAAFNRCQAWRDAFDRREKAWHKEWYKRCENDSAYAAQGYVSAPEDWQPLKPWRAAR